jgi:hypothetical protein
VKGRLEITRAGAVAIVVAALVIPGSAAMADQAKYHVRPTIKLNRKPQVDKFKGALRSKERACVAKRKIKLHHRSVSQQSKSGVIAKFRTDGRGKWTFRPKKNENGDRYATPGTYEVRVGEARVRTGGGEVTCREKNSSSLFVG